MAYYDFDSPKRTRLQRLEKWLDNHNHTMELIRTLGTAVTILIALKVFGVI